MTTSVLQTEPWAINAAREAQANALKNHPSVWTPAGRHIAGRGGCRDLHHLFGLPQQR